MMKQTELGMRSVAAVLFLLLITVQTGVARAESAPPVVPDRAEPLPKELENVGITERLNEQVPLDLEFLDESGKIVRIGDYFSGDRPVILNPVYYTCPMLCGLVLNGVIEGMQGMEWTAGNQFEVVTLSIDPTETPTYGADSITVLEGLEAGVAV